MPTTKWYLTPVLAVTLLGIGPPAGGTAARAAAPDEGLANVDLRATTTRAVPAPARAARRALERVPGPLADVRTDPATGAVSSIGSPAELLSAPSSADPRARSRNRSPSPARHSSRWPSPG